MLGLFVAAQIAIVAHAPDTVFACDAVDITVAVSRRGFAIPSLSVPSFGAFDVLRKSAISRVDRVAGSTPLTVAEYRFVVTTDRVGSYVIPAFEARLGDERAVSRALPLAVRARRGRGTPSVIARARIDTSGNMNLGDVAFADTVFVGQQATYEVAVFLNQSARDRLRRNPTFYPPEMQAMLAYDLPAPNAQQRERIGSQCFDALLYRRALFPLVAGRLVIPPAQLVYSTGLSSTSLFSREESHELQTDSVTIVAVEPPMAGRPAEYIGTVGEVRLAADVESARARVGDPMLLTVRVAGRGNVKLFPRPVVRVPWGALVAADERVTIDSSSARIGGVKEFDWVLTPRIAGEFDVPPVRYGYFDPSRRQYDVAIAPGKHVRVAPGALASADTGQAESPLAIRTRYGGPAWPPMQSYPAFWLVMALAPVPALVGRVRRRAKMARERRDRAPDPMRALTISPARDPVALRRQYVRALAQRLGCHPQDFTHPGALERVLSRAGVSRGTATQAELLLRELDAAAYAGTGAVPRDASINASNIARAVDAEALSRAELPFWVPALLLAVSLGVVASAIAADNASSHFRRGVSAYVREEYPAAREAFAQAVALAPASPDAWANFGTAAWGAADTARAVFGWRQALAIQPGASDVQSNMSAFRVGSPSAPGWVPSVPRGATVWLFSALWLSAWVFAWMGGGRRANAWMERLPMPLAACALVIGLFSIELESRISGDRLAVVRQISSLSSDPALGMGRGPTVATGEIVRVAGRRGTWTRVEASDDREGWIASSRLLLIADRRPPRD